MLTNESIKIWYPKIQALLQKHKMYGYNDPGGAELIHPQFGKCRISAWDDEDDYWAIVKFLKEHGVEP